MELEAFLNSHFFGTLPREARDAFLLWTYMRQQGVSVGRAAFDLSARLVGSWKNPTRLYNGLRLMSDTMMRLGARG
jgi:hypothetical protein